MMGYKGKKTYTFDEFSHNVKEWISQIPWCYWQEHYILQDIYRQSSNNVSFLTLTISVCWYLMTLIWMSYVPLLDNIRQHLSAPAALPCQAGEWWVHWPRPRSHTLPPTLAVGGAHQWLDAVWNPQRHEAVLTVANHVVPLVEEAKGDVWLDDAGGAEGLVSPTQSGFDAWEGKRVHGVGRSERNMLKFSSI